MKNLKKALSLVLASAMLIGMMVVGTGAAHSDVKAEHNEEAIAVVSAAGIMGAGDTFNPDGKMTRGEMAVVMVNLLDLDVADYKGASNFTDAGWAADYIDACYANGVMAGVSATEFGTNVQVTTAQAALMMLKALGYFELKPINDWMLDTRLTVLSLCRLVCPTNKVCTGIVSIALACKLQGCACHASAKRKLMKRIVQFVLHCFHLLLLHCSIEICTVTVVMQEHYVCGIAYN